MSENGRYSGAHLLIAFLAGAAAGAVVALLTAPRSGRETREKVQTWTEDLRAKALTVPDATREAWGRATQAAKDTFAEALREEG